MIQTTVESAGIATPPTLLPETPVAEAADRLRDPGVSVLPVLSDERVVGVVTASDLVAMVAETAEHPTVGEVMSAPVTTVTPATDLWMAAERMRCDGVRHLVVTSEGQYRGVVSATDLAPYCSRASLDIEWSGEPLCVEAPTEEARAGD